MSCVFKVEAWHGDSGGYVTGLSVTSTKALNLENLPDLSSDDVEFIEDFTTTESWAYIDWYDKGDKESPGIGIKFYNHYDSDEEVVWASSYALYESLKNVVMGGEYVEKIYHRKSGNRTEYVYKLPPEVFKGV